MKHRKLAITAVVGLLAAVITVIVVVVVAVPLTSDAVRHRTIRTLSDRLDADVTIGDLHWRVFPTIHAEGTDLTVRRRRHADPLPVIAIKRFAVNAGVAGLVRRHVTRVTVDGLVINVLPDDDNDHHGDDDKRHERSTTTPSSGDADLPVGRDVVIDTLVTADAQVVVVPRNPKKEPKIWAIHSLELHNVGAGLAMPFTATLTNAVPPGEIETKGTFGPWQREDPGRTPLAGTFTFAKADLSVFEGIAGTLSAHGKFDGALDRIVVDGETETPDFTIKLSRHPFALHTTYKATVDGTSGDTYLDRINGKFLQSTLVAKGSVVDGPKGEHGRTVALDITLDPARIEDVLLMAVSTAPPMRGALRLTTKFLLPPGRTDVADRLRLNGQFAVDRVRFMNYDVQQKIEELSHRSRGLKEDDRTEHVVSDFQGRFALGGGRLEVPAVSFSVPGANVQMAGRYALKPETLDFRGSLNMNAKVSETQSGIKSLLLKVVDPLFRRRGGGSAIPIRVTGTRSEPNFGLDMGRVFKRGDSK